ncbi:MAG: SPOR domain-containing protein [Treponema sp.]|nr:SPOR domain-containing protein [Treponema sp.]
MEKEMKKLLLVAVSVGVFLLVTITVALIVITPKQQPQETSFSSSVPYSRARPAQNNTGNLPAQIYDDNIPTVYLNGNERTEVTIASDRNDGNNLTLHVPIPVPTENESTRIESTPSAQIVRIPSASAPSSAVVKTTPAQTAQPSARPSTTAAAPKPATTTASSRAASSGKTISDYWIQTGAFSAIVRAEDARELLASKELVSIIENRIIEGKTWYRVRLGPYTSEREAHYWLAIVKTIDGFEQSQIRHTVRQQ